MKPKLPVATWAICTETRLNIAVHANKDGFVIQLTGNDQSCCEEYGPYPSLGQALEEINNRFGAILDRK